MKRIAVTLGFFVLFGSLAILPQPGTRQALGQPHLVIAETDWPPYFFAGKPDTPEGFGKELLKMILSEMGYGLDFKFYPVNRMYSCLEKGEIDLCVFSHNKEREEFLIYAGEPLFISGYRPVVLADRDIHIRSIKDFDSLRVGHLAGLKYSKEYFDYIENRREGGSLVTTTSGDGCLKMLLSGMIDTFVDTRETTLWRARQMNALDKIKISDFDIQTKDYFVTLSKQTKVISDKRAFLDNLDARLRAAKKDGRYARLAQKYGIE